MLRIERLLFLHQSCPQVPMCPWLTATFFHVFGFRTLDSPLMTPFVFCLCGTCCPTFRHYLESHTGPSHSLVAWITARTVLTGLLLPCFVVFSAQLKENPLKARQFTSLCLGPSVAIRTKVLALTPASLTSSDPCALSPTGCVIGTLLPRVSALPSPGYPHCWCPVSLQKPSLDPWTLSVPLVTVLLPWQYPS